jgi:hypothetical protein
VRTGRGTRTSRRIRCSCSACLTCPEGSQARASARVRVRSCRRSEEVAHAHATSSRDRDTDSKKRLRAGVEKLCCYRQWDSLPQRLSGLRRGALALGSERASSCAAGRRACAKCASSRACEPSLRRRVAASKLGFGGKSERGALAPLDCRGESLRGDRRDGCLPRQPAQPALTGRGWVVVGCRTPAESRAAGRKERAAKSSR